MITHQSGEFNTRVTIEKLDAGQDGYGGPAITWSTYATWWCRINPVSGKESYADQAIQAQANYKMDGSFVAGVTAKMRVNNHGVLYEIASPPLDWDDRHAYMTLLAKTGV